MKKEIAIITDTNSGISIQEATEWGIYLIPMPVIVDGESYFENVSISQENFYQELSGGASVSTSQPAPAQLMEIWEALLEDYEALIYLPMSSGLSGGTGTASALAEEYDGRIYVVDNHRISVTLRQSVLEARYMASQGKSASEIVQALETDGLNSIIYISVNTLELLKKSGRVTAAGATVATVLNLKPVLQIQGGKLDAFCRARGMKSAMREMIAGLAMDRETRFAGQKIMIRAAYSGSRANGEEWQETLQQAFPDLQIGLDPLPISIACHVGEGALGVGMMRDII